MECGENVGRIRSLSDMLECLSPEKKLSSGLIFSNKAGAYPTGDSSCSNLFDSLVALPANVLKQGSIL